MNIYAKKGHKVRLTTINAGQKPEQEVVKQHLLLNEVYTIDYTNVSNWATQVYLQEVPGIQFNSVFFTDVVAQSQMDNENHKDYRRYH